jgi:peptidoglycan-associated lipoprotein
MKRVILSIVLINLLTACAYFKPVKRADKAKAEPTATTPAETAPAAPVTETAPIGSAPAADVNAQTLANPESAAATNAAATEAADSAAKAEAAAKADPLNDPASALAKRSVHFPFDVDAIQEADKQVIQAHGEYLGVHPEHKVRSEGNADERGSSEYNLALGQRRANNTKKALVLSGAHTDQIEAISYGEEKPVATGHDEESWAQNRRTDINYK